MKKLLLFSVIALLTSNLFAQMQGLAKNRTTNDCTQTVNFTNASVFDILLRKNNWSATTAPAATDDSGDNYGVGSIWVDTTNQKCYVCSDSTVDAAVWVDISSDGIPSQSGNSGKFLTTDGTTASWGTPSSGGDMNGPSSSVDENISVFDGTDGKTLKDSGVNISAVTANTAKETNATHTGEVTGSTALTIADNVIDEANLKLDETPTNDYVLTADSTKSGGMKWAEAGTTSPLTTKGDLYTYSTDNARLGVGSDGQRLVADSGETTGLKWESIPVTSFTGDFTASTSDSYFSWSGNELTVTHGLSGSPNPKTLIYQVRDATNGNTWDVDFKSGQATTTTLILDFTGCGKPTTETLTVTILTGGGGAGTTRTGVYRTQWVDAAAMVAQETNGATATTNELAAFNTMIDGYDFPDGTDSFVQFKWSMPEQWDLGSVKFKIYWTSSTAVGTGSVYWVCSGKAIGNDDTIDRSFGTLVSAVDTFIADKDMHITSATSDYTVTNTPETGDCVFFRIGRDGDNASDTYTQSAKLLGIKIQYKESTTETTSW